MSAVKGVPYVYVFVDAVGTPLYIGITRDLARRVREHRKAAWHERAAHWTAFPYPTLDAALRDESRLISMAQPIGNRQSRRSGPSLLTLMFDMFAGGQLPNGDDMRLASLLKEAKAA